MPAKDITRDIGNANYNAFSTNAPAVADNSQIIKAIGIAGQVGVAEYQNYQKTQAESSLVGQEGAQVPGLEGFGEARVAPSDTFNLDKALNLRQIKKARDQGLINETQARIKVGQAIRSVAEDYPGQEDTLRKRAGIFFGKFGEGDLTLTKSDAEKKQQDIYVSQFLKPGVAAGIIDPTDPFNDTVGQANWKKLIYDRSIRSQQRDIVDTNAAIGKATGLDVANSYVVSDVSDSIAEGLNHLIQLQKSGQAITDPLEIKGLFESQKARHKAILRTKLSRVKGITSEQKAAALKEIDTAYGDLNALVDDGSLSKMLKEKSDLLTSMATVYGVSKFPQLFAAEKVSPGIGSQLLKLSDTFGRMTSDAQRKAYIDRQPPIMQQFIKGTLNDPTSILKPLTEALRSNTTSGNDFLDGLFLKIAEDGAKANSEYPDAVDKDFKDQSIAYMLKNAPSIRSLDNLNNASTALRIRKDKRKMNMLSNKFVAHETSVLPNAHSLFVSGNTNTRQVKYIFDFNTHKFNMDLQGTEWPLGHSQDEANVVDQLNILYRTVDYYGQDLGVDPVDWVMSTLKTVNAQPQEQGTFEKGNIPLTPVLHAGEQKKTSEGRPVYTTPDGNYITERTITVTTPDINGGKPTNIPTVYDGKIVSQEEAIHRVVQAGGFDPITHRALDGYSSIEEAVKAAQERTHSLGVQLDKK